MILQLEDKVLDRVDALAAKLGIAAEHLWEVFSTQAVIQGWSTMILTMVPAIVLILVSLNGFRRRAKGVVFYVTETYDGNKSVGDHPSVNGVVTIASGVMGAIMSLISLTNLPNWIGKILNPEFYAWLEIQKIL